MMVNIFDEMFSKNSWYKERLDCTLLISQSMLSVSHQGFVTLNTLVLSRNWMGWLFRFLNFLQSDHVETIPTKFYRELNISIFIGLVVPQQNKIVFFISHGDSIISIVARPGAQSTFINSYIFSSSKENPLKNCQLDRMVRVSCSSPCSPTTRLWSTS